MKKYTQIIEQELLAIHIGNLDKQLCLSTLFERYPHINSISSNNNFLIYK
jgi:hypothetical protein